MDEQTRDLYAHLLFTAIVSSPHSGLGSVVLNVAAQLCVADDIYAKFMEDVHQKRETYKINK